RPIGAGGVRGASRAGSASVITTHALFARKVQRKLSNGFPGFAAGGSLFDRKGCGPIAPFSWTPQRGQRPARPLPKIPAEPSPELRIPGAAAQTRVVSMAGIRLGSWERVMSETALCHEVGSLWRVYPVHGLCEQRRSL